MAVYKVPVMLSEGVQCCAKHSISESGQGEAVPHLAKVLASQDDPSLSLPHTVGAEKAPHFVKSLDRDAVYLSPCRVTNRYTVIVPLSSMHCENTCMFT